VITVVRLAGLAHGFCFGRSFLIFGFDQAQDHTLGLSPTKPAIHTVRRVGYLLITVNTHKNTLFAERFFLSFFLTTRKKMLSIPWSWTDSKECVPAKA